MFVIHMEFLVVAIYLHGCVYDDIDISILVVCDVKKPCLNFQHVILFHLPVSLSHIISSILGMVFPFSFFEISNLDFLSVPSEASVWNTGMPMYDTHVEWYALYCTGTGTYCTCTNGRDLIPWMTRRHPFFDLEVEEVIAYARWKMSSGSYHRWKGRKKRGIPVPSNVFHGPLVLNVASHKSLEPIVSNIQSSTPFCQRVNFNPKPPSPAVWKHFRPHIPPTRPIPYIS